VAVVPEPGIKIIFVINPGILETYSEINRINSAARGTGGDPDPSTGSN
jgi:hypothetical protein